MASGEGKTRRKQWGGGRLENSGKVCGSCCTDRSFAIVSGGTTGTRVMRISRVVTSTNNRPKHGRDECRNHYLYQPDMKHDLLDSLNRKTAGQRCSL